MFNLRKKIIFLLLAIFLVADLNLSFLGVLAADEKDVLKSIDKTEDQLEKKEKELNEYTSDLQVTQSQINTTANLINKTETEISRKEKEIKNLEDRIELNRNILINYTQEVYYGDQEMAWVMVLGDQNFNDYLGNLDQMLNANKKIMTIIEEIGKDKENIEGVKKELAEKKEEHEDLLAIKQSEKKEIVADINETKLTISQLQAKLSKLRSTLSSFLGASYDLDDVIDAVKYAEDKTGVRKEFIFAMLDKETDLGRYTGGCYYSKGSNQVKKHMKAIDKADFITLMDELGYDENAKKLSCWPGYGYGGAMGIAQFMPSTWKGYKSDIASRTGNKPANPWRLEDGVIGMALKLRAAGAASKSKEHYAAKVYYCGGPSSPYWKNRCEAYANTVISWSKGYDDYFK
jgi:peptidoglycan hydrolase CwlO-like protein